MSDNGLSLEKVEGVNATILGSKGKLCNLNFKTHCRMGFISLSTGGTCYYF